MPKPKDGDDIAQVIWEQRPKVIAGSRVDCAVCGVQTQLEPVGVAYRCQSCRSAINKHGQRYAGPSALQPSPSPREKKCR